MKKYIVIIFSMIVFSCSEENFDGNDFKDDSSISSIKGTWKLISIEDFAANTVTLKDDDNSWGFDVLIEFNDTENPSVITGRITTNSVFGEFDYESDRTILLSKLATTKINQPYWGNEFSKAILNGVIDFKINDSSLRFYFNNKNNSVTLAKE